MSGYYNSDDFITELNALCENKINAEELYQKLISMKIPEKMCWTEFEFKIRETTEKFLKDSGATALNFHEVYTMDGTNNSKDFSKRKTFDEIIGYLDILKGMTVEKSLKSMIYNSNFEDEHHNYFACIFKVLVHKQGIIDYTSFLCCYAQMIITKQISRLMLNWIIAKYLKHCTGGIDKSLGRMLNSDDVKYEDFRNRSSFFRLIFSLRFPGTDDIETKAKDMMMKCFGEDDFNPRSFLDMMYYYGLLNFSSNDEINSSLRMLTENVIMFIYSDTDKKTVSEFVKEIPLDSVKSFLDFNPESLEIIAPLFKGKYSLADLKIIAEKKFIELEVNYFKSDVSLRETYTYEYFAETLKPVIKRTKDVSELIAWMVPQRRFYEGYFRIISRTRHDEFCPTYRESDEEIAAYEIVFSDTLNFNAGDYVKIGTSEWKKNIIEGKYEERTEKIAKILDPVLDKISKYSGESEYMDKVQSYTVLDRNQLYEAINYELSRYSVKEKEISRNEYLLETFKRCASAEDDAVDFMMDLEDDETMRSMRWDTFDSSRYQDAMLYMCLNTSKPFEMFDRINSTEGYSFFQ